MSIAGIGAFGAGSLSQMLSSLLSKLDTTSETSATTTDTTTSRTATTSDSAGALKGPTKPSLSSMILGTLIGLQQQSSDSASQSSSTSSDPVQSLFSAMDSDSNGTVTQSELEGYIEQQGGTQNEADSLYSMLTQSDSSGITEDQLASQAPPPPPSGGPGGPGGGPGGPPPQGGDQSSDSTNGIGDALVKLLDTNDDSSVSKSELENYVTSQGGTSDQADAYFTALDTSGDDSLTTSDFSDAAKKFENNIASNTTSPVLRLLDAFTKNASSTKSSLSLTA